MTQTGAESGITVRTKFFPLAFLLYFFKPKIHVDDGYAIDEPWGTHFFALPPGRHTVRCYVPYLFYKTMGDNSVSVDVAPGQVVDVQWRAPWLVSSRARSTSVVRDRRPQLTRRPRSRHRRARCRRDGFPIRTVGTSCVTGTEPRGPTTCQTVAQWRKTRCRAEGQGFEPWVLAHNGFQDRPVRPLRHPSGEHVMARASLRSVVPCASWPHRPGRHANEIILSF